MISDGGGRSFRACHVWAKHKELLPRFFFQATWVCSSSNSGRVMASLHENHVRDRGAPQEASLRIETFLFDGKLNSLYVIFLDVVFMLYPLCPSQISQRPLKWCAKCENCCTFVSFINFWISFLKKMHLFSVSSIRRAQFCSYKRTWLFGGSEPFKTFPCLFSYQIIC